jgi:hypothetical protein
MLLKTEITNATLVQKFVLWLCKELQIQPDSISIHGEDDLDGVYGLCMDVTESEFVILVKTGKRNIGEIFTTIAHEMIHVKQYMKENLGHWMDNCHDIPYMQRWWEVEAFSKSVHLVEKFAKEL